MGSGEIWWLGPAAIAHPVRDALGWGDAFRIVTPWSTHEDERPWGLIDATALGPDPDVVAACAYVDAILTRPEAPARVVHVVPLAWLGRGAPHHAGRAGYVVAHARASALRAAPSSTTVNTVTVPTGFPDAAPSPSAAVQAPVGVADLCHALAFFLDPANAYVVGQTLSVCGGDDAWGNHSL